MEIEDMHGKKELECDLKVDYGTTTTVTVLM